LDQDILVRCPCVENGLYDERVRRRRHGRMFDTRRKENQ